MKKLVTLLFFLFASQQGLADNADTEELIRLIEALDNYSASFNQLVEEQDGFVLDENSGVMSFEKPNKLYWQVLEPFPNVLVSDGVDVYFHDPDLDQVTIRRWSADPAQNPMAVFLNAQNLGDYYHIEKNDGRFLLTPLAKDVAFSNIQLVFTHGQPFKMQFYDHIGQKTSIEFSTLEQGVIPDSPYEFLLPVMADVIDDR